MLAIKVTNLTKKYDKIVAIKNINFEVEKASFFAFLGPNGAGKSTTINIISSLLEKTKGDIKVFGNTVGQDDEIIREQIGIVFQSSILDDYLTVRENLMVRASFYNINKLTANKRIEKLSELIGMEEYIDRRYSTLSGGEKRKADIARALINSPKILILDEPTTGLDPKSRKNIWSIIEKLRSKTKMTIFLTTHYMEETKDANKVVILNKGKIIASGSPDELKSKYSYDVLRIIPKNKSLLESLKKDKIKYEKLKDSIKIKLKNNFESLKIIEKYKNEIENFEVLIGDMDDVFLNLIGKEVLDK